MHSKPNIVLVHGALTDASVWNGVVRSLRDKGFVTVAPAMPLRGLGADADYLSWFLDTLDEPVVVVGHSYGGSVISHPAIAKRQVKALVFVAAFAPDTGETTGELNNRWPGSRLGDATALVRPCPDGQELYLQPDRFREVYAGDLDPATVALMAAAQRPLNTNALGESFAGRPAWSGIRSWAVVSTDDNSLPVEAQRFMARRANAIATEIDASHASPVSRAAVVAGVVSAAAEAVSQAPA